MPSVDEMVAKLEKHLQENKGELKDWVMLGRSYKHLGRYGEAVNAFTAAGELEQFAGAGEQATQGILGGLGFGDTEATDAAFQNFLNSTGFRSQLAAGSEAITGNQAAQGLLNSGSTLKRLTRFGQDLGQQGFSNFLGNLGGVANRGLTAAGGQASAISGSGQAAAAARRRGDEAFSSGIGQAAQGGFSMLGI